MSYFRPYSTDQAFLLPPSMHDWLDEGDLAYFVLDVVQHLDLSAIYSDYDGRKGGQPPYNPTMMTSLLFYAYCKGVFSSRKIEEGTWHSIPFRIISGNQHPDHDTIAEFRRRHLKRLSGLFVQVLQLCQKAGLVKLGHVSLDGSKVRANASKHKAMSYDRMEKKAKELETDVARLLAEAQAVDEGEDAEFGKGRRGDELPDDLRFKASRLKKIKEAMAALEAEAQIEAEAKREAIRNWETEYEASGKKPPGRAPKLPSDKPDAKSQRNFTDPDSRIMKDGASKAFEQSYNCQAMVDSENQVILASHVTQAANDKEQVKPAVEKMESNLDGKRAKKLSGDNGYFSEKNVAYLEKKGIDAYLATGRQKHSEKPPPVPRGHIPASASVKERMARKLRTKRGRETYSKRKEIVEPVFGQIKEARGFRRFLLRGMEKVPLEWDLVCLTHNILKLFKGGNALNWT